jgi:acetyl esterase/lipase
MKSPLRLVLALAALALLTAAASTLTAQVATLPNVTYQPSETINLWPGIAPGETGNIGPERILPNRPRPFDQIDNVSVPTLAIFHPPADKRTGTGVLVIPGGGLDRLAIETEGYEVAQWLNEHGITAFMLKYRVPRRTPGPGWRVGVQDAQRAMGLIRAHAAEWKVDPDAIGTIGFSAGAEINVRLSVLHAEPRQYPRVDAADDLSSRPDFNIAMYGGGYTNNNGMNEDVGSRINTTTPPMFIGHAFDDAALSSVILVGALKRANIPS